MLDDDSETTMLLAKIMSIEILLDIIWTNELAKTDHPVEEAKKLKQTVLDLILVDEDDPLGQAAFDCTRERLDAIIERVRSL